VLLNAFSALQYAGLFEEPVCAPELGDALAYERRRSDLLDKHLEAVMSAAPQHAEPHRVALDGAVRRVAWIEHRMEEERVLEAWRRENPPTAARELRAILYYLGFAKNPFPTVTTGGPESLAPKVARAA
jgi:hypothetical protein